MLPRKQACALSGKDGILEQQSLSGGTKSHRNGIGIKIGSRAGSWNENVLSPRIFRVMNHGILLIGHL